MRPRGGWGVELLGHRSASHDQVACLAVGEGPKRQEEWKGSILRVWVILTVFDAVDIHIVESQSHSVRKHSCCKLHIRNVLASHVTLAQLELIDPNWPSSVTDVWQPTHTVAGVEVFASKRKGQIRLRFKPLVESDSPCFSFSDCCVIYASSPVELAEFSLL